MVVLVNSKCLYLDASLGFFRSGSCPADSNSLFGAEGSQHMKTGSFDSTVPLVPQQKISRPKPVVREK